MRPPISICLASYNGFKYINEQVSSIMSELQSDDELIIVDDYSNKETQLLLSNYNDYRIKVFFNKKNHGHVKTFEKAISYAEKTIIILSDQDDIWIPGRINTLVENLVRPKKLLVTSNFRLINKFGSAIETSGKLVSAHTSSTYFYNIVGIILGTRTYYGCTMAFSRDILKFATPFPLGVESHDLWLALVANILGENNHIENITVSRRLHSCNVTPSKKRSFFKIIKSRFIFLYLIFIAIKRKYSLKL
jgi:glycosyltransferase involved in cell wall biosynthesis